MTRIAFACLGVAMAATLAACQRGTNNAGNTTSPAPANTQPNASADLSRGDKAGAAPGDCGDLPSADDLKRLVRQAPGEGSAGGMFDGRMEWVAVVNRRGEVCAAAVSTDEPASSWQGSASIAKAKAYTANAFSTDTQHESGRAVDLRASALPEHLAQWSEAG